MTGHVAESCVKESPYDDIGTGATIYLLYNSRDGKNCVVTMADNTTNWEYMYAGLAVAGGQYNRDAGKYNVYAGPVYVYARDRCVSFSGGYKGDSWVSDWGHCGG